MLPDSTPLVDAKAWLRERVRKGETCPCCTQFAKVYRRKLNTGMVRVLIWLYHQPTEAGGWVDVANTAPVWVHRNREIGRLALWGFVEARSIEKGDSRKDSGVYRITETGSTFVLGKLRVPAHALIYANRLLRLDDTSMVAVRDALGKFDYEELMRA